MPTLGQAPVDPALVHFLRQATVSHAPVSTDPQIVALVTLLQLQTTASSGIAGPRRSVAAGRISSSGFSGRAMPEATIGRRVP